MKRKKEQKMFGGKHLQHTKKFNYELNNQCNNKLNPFRFYDEVWVVGKHKGKKLDETPLSYIQWALDNMNLSQSCKNILNNKLK